MSTDSSVDQDEKLPTEERDAKAVSTRRATLGLLIATTSGVGWIAVAIWGSLFTAPMFEALNYTPSLTQPPAALASEFRNFLLCLVGLLLCAVALAIGLVRFSRQARRVGGDTGILKTTARVAIIGPALGALTFLIYVVVSAYTVIPPGY